MYYKVMWISCTWVNLDFADQPYKRFREDDYYPEPEPRHHRDRPFDRARPPTGNTVQSTLVAFADEGSRFRPDERGAVVVRRADVHGHDRRVGIGAGWRVSYPISLQPRTGPRQLRVQASLRYSASKLT